MKITREWAMPSRDTFSIKPIKELIESYINTVDGFWVDPFVGHNKYANYSNDLNPDIKADCHLDAIQFLKQTPSQHDYCLFFDPPYTMRQVSECYKHFGYTVTSEMTRCNWYSDIKNEIMRIIPQGGYVICAGYDSNGIGMSRGFEMIELKVVPHGGCHHDTLVTVERKVNGVLP